MIERCARSRHQRQKRPAPVLLRAVSAPQAHRARRPLPWSPAAWIQAMPCRRGRRGRKCTAGEESAARQVIEIAGPIVTQATSWPGLHAALAEHGIATPPRARARSSWWTGSCSRPRPVGRPVWPNWRRASARSSRPRNAMVLHHCRAIAGHRRSRRHGPRRHRSGAVRRRPAGGDRGAGGPRGLR